MTTRHDMEPHIDTTLGKKIEKPKDDPKWRPAPDVDADKCIEVDEDGHLRTNDPRNNRILP
jgi:hypothetical protein